MRNKLVAMPVLRPDDQTAVNESELDIDESTINDVPEHELEQAEHEHIMTVE